MISQLSDLLFNLPIFICNLLSYLFFLICFLMFLVSASWGQPSDRTIRVEALLKSSRYSPHATASATFNILWLYAPIIFFDQYDFWILFPYFDCNWWPCRLPDWWKNILLWFEEHMKGGGSHLIKGLDLDHVWILKSPTLHSLFVFPTARSILCTLFKPSA